MTNASEKGMFTRVIHAGNEERVDGAVVTPIFQSAMFLYAGEEDYHDLKYIRLNNTANHRELHGRLASLESAEAAVVTASGMAAISTAILSCVKAGDHVLFQDCLYGGTHTFVAEDLPRFGVETDFIDGCDASEWESKLKPNTKAVYFESVSNPLMRVSDLEAAVAFAKAHDLVSLVDNTFPSPTGFRPPELGFDLSLHSATKYLNGHSDIVAGLIAGSEERVHAASKLLAHLGGSLDPHACFLLERGIKTLAVRMRAHAENADKVARFLAGHPKVAQVNFPGLEDHPEHERAKRLFDHMGGMLSLELEGGLEAANDMLSRLELFYRAPSLGGVESLATRPATTSHSSMTPEERARAGVTDGLVRLSIGIEDGDDLVRDLERALG